MDGIFIIKDLKLYWLRMFSAGYNWGWILGTGAEKMPYVCKISKEDIFKIQEHERGPGKKYSLIKHMWNNEKLIASQTKVD